MIPYQQTSIEQLPPYMRSARLSLIKSLPTYLSRNGFEAPYPMELGPGKHGPAIQDRVKIGLDPKADPGCHIYWDLNYGIPLPDESVSRITSNQVLEHIWNIILLFNEMHRVLVPGGTMEHCVPHYAGIHADGDPTHVRRFTPTSFHYYSLRDDGSRFVEQFADYGIECSFELTETRVRKDLDITACLKKPEAR